MANETAIVIMAKYPQAGKTKTRLCPPLTQQQAAEFYSALLQDTINLVAHLENVDLAIAISPPEAQEYFAEIVPPGCLLLPVKGTDIGECLIAAMSGLLERGYQKAIALNSDGPTLPSSFLVQASQELDLVDLVIGPSDDGGYYLVGVKRLVPEIFQSIAWSTRMVLTQTLERVIELSMSVKLLPAWYDVDIPEDLARIRSDLQKLPDGSLEHTRRVLSHIDQDSTNA